MSRDQPPPGLTAAELETIDRIYAELLGLANHPIPAVRGGVRLALAEVAQVRNALGGGSEAYGRALEP